MLKQATGQEGDPHCRSNGGKEMEAGSVLRAEMRHVISIVKTKQETQKREYAPCRWPQVQPPWYK